MPRKIGSGQKTALLAAFSAASSFAPAKHASEFVLIGGSALVVLGGSRLTSDVDVVITPAALQAFEAGAAKDRRFTKAVEMWAFSFHDISTSFEFLASGGGFVGQLRAPQQTEVGFVAQCVDLALMKASAVISRGEQRGIDDLEFILIKMEETDKDFGDLDPDGEEMKVLKEAGKEIGAMPRSCCSLYFCELFPLSYLRRVLNAECTLKLP